MFIDRVRVLAHAGKGGDGSASFRREKFIPKGGPDGGDGGNGGHIILYVDTHRNELTHLFFQPILQAKNGHYGAGRQKSGKSAPHLRVPVPLGTVVYRIDSPISHVLEEKEKESENAIEKRLLILKDEYPIADLDDSDSEFILCHGGIGGKGNIHFKSSCNRTPLRYTEGTAGEEGVFLLEMRMIADAGLVGYPNAGKSTLLSAISDAHPKIASYPFTTRTPHLGVVSLDNYSRITIADIPGLVQGAHQNKGLGHQFLRHIMRCHLLIFVLDIAGSEGRNPLDDLETLREEVYLYNPILEKRPWCIVANKIDIASYRKYLALLRENYPEIAIFPISAQSNKGTDALKIYLDQRGKVF